jgi:hypothetical protein
MVDFGELRDKAEDLAEKHADQVDEAIDKAAGMLGTKFGHQSEVEKGAEKLEDLLPGQGQQAGSAHKGKGAGRHGGQHDDRQPGQPGRKYGGKRAQ